jgi:uncharacterized membrane protein YqaE (UPF0057 family)
MLYLLALLAPPIACLAAGRFWHAALNFLLCCTLIGIPVAMIHAWYVVKATRTLAATNSSSTLPERHWHCGPW